MKSKKRSLMKIIMLTESVMVKNIKAQSTTCLYPAKDYYEIILVFDVSHENMIP